MPDPRQGIHVHVCQALHGTNERKLVARDLARSLEGGAGNVNALHDARLDGTRGLHELDLLGKHLGGVLGANGLHGIEDIKPGIDGILDSGHPRLGIELGDLSLTEAADMVDAVDALLPSCARSPRARCHPHCCKCWCMPEPSRERA